MDDSINTDRDFFEAEIGSVLSGLFGAALRVSRNRDDADDLVAETVAKAWQSFDSLRERGHFRAWIFRILMNTAISAGRRRSAGPRLESIDDSACTEDGFSLFEELHEPLLFWSRSPETEFLNKILREDLERAVDALPDGLRVVVVLSDLECFSYQEIADMLKIPVGTVRSRLARGRARLQQALWEHGVESGLIRRGPRAEESNDG
jgi:RNA polymerase sigma-70 factor (ECF subfamily)